MLCVIYGFMYFIADVQVLGSFLQPSTSKQVPLSCLGSSHAGDNISQLITFMTGKKGTSWNILWLELFRKDLNGKEEPDTVALREDEGGAR